MPVKDTIIVITTLLAGLVSVPARSQYTETFEGVTATGNIKPTVFISNGQSFTLSSANCATGGTFGVFIPSQSFLFCGGSSGSGTNSSSVDFGVGTSCANGVCSGTSAKFIDNTGFLTANVSQAYSIKTTDNALFTVKSLFLFLSSDAGNSVSITGSVTFQGKVAGNVVFTYNKNTGFNTNYSVNNGFTFIDFASVNATNVNIDELWIQGGTTINYVAIDNFSWGNSSPLPIKLYSFLATAKSDKVVLDWSASMEAEADYYELERGQDGSTFLPIARVKGLADVSSYNYTDYLPEKHANYYRLKLVNKDGRYEYSSVVKVFMEEVLHTITVYPNPVRDELHILNRESAPFTFQLMNISGNMLLELLISGDEKKIDVSMLTKGIYHYRIIGKGSRFLKYGKLIKK